MQVIKLDSVQSTFNPETQMVQFPEKGSLQVAHVTRMSHYWVTALSMEDRRKLKNHRVYKSLNEVLDNFVSIVVSDIEGNRIANFYSINQHLKNMVARGSRYFVCIQKANNVNDLYNMIDTNGKLSLIK